MNIKETIEFCFAHEHDIEQSILSAKLDAGGKSGGGNGHCRVSDPTAMTAIRHAEELGFVDVEYGPKGLKEIFRLRHPEKWLRIIHETKDYYSKRGVQGMLIELHFLQGLPVSVICEKAGISKAFYHIMINDILTFATACAIGKGIVANRR